MEEVIKRCLSNDEDLCKKYLTAEQKFYRKLGSKYEIVQIDLDLDDEVVKKLFVSLAKSGICFDELMSCMIKEEIVRREMDKL